MRNVIKGTRSTRSGNREARCRTKWKKILCPCVKPQHLLTSHADISHVVEDINSITHNLNRKTSWRKCVTVHITYFNLKLSRRLNSIKCSRASRGCQTRENFTEVIFQSCIVSECKTLSAMCDRGSPFKMLWCKKGKTMDNVCSVSKQSLHRPRETLRALEGWGSQNF